MLPVDKRIELLVENARREFRESEYVGGYELRRAYPEAQDALLLLPEADIAELYSARKEVSGSILLARRAGM